MSNSLLPFSIQRLLSTRVARFGLVGASGVFINLGFLGLFADVLHIEARLASAIAIELSILWNFMLNNSWTFKDRNEEASSGWVLRCVRYNTVSLLGAGLQWGVFVLLSWLMARSLDRGDIGLLMYVAQLVGISLGMAWNFISNFHWTWAQKKRANGAVEPLTPSEQTEPSR